MKKHRKLKKALAFVLVFCITWTSTGIPEALVHSGLIRYLGCVGDNIVTYYKSHLVHADDGSDSTETPTPTQAPIINVSCSGIHNFSPSLSVDCVHGDLEGGITALQNSVGAVGTTVGEVKTKVETLEKMLSDEGDIYKVIDSLKGSPDQEDKDLADLAESLVTIAGNTGTTADRLLWVYDKLHFDGKSLAELQKDNTTILSADIQSVHDQLTYNSKSLATLQHEENELMKALFNTWFIKNPYYVPGEGYSMYAIADNVSITKVTLNNSLGYTNPDGTVNDSTPKYIWAQEETRTLQGDLYTLNNNFYETFGYYHYTPDENGEIKEVSEWNPSIAKDFKTLLNMFKKYNVAHVYSANVEVGADWRPTPDDLKYTRERVLNMGFANLYDGHWSVPASEYTPTTNHRYEYVLGKDIMNSLEEYVFDVNADKMEVSVSYYTEEMDPYKYLNYSDMFRILYRAVGQDIVTYTEASVFNSSIVAETSPASVGLSNIDILEGYDVYVATNRNNVRHLNKETNEVFVTDKYLSRAISDGFIRSMTHEEATTTYPTYAEVWYYAAKVMQRYGEPEMNSTEVNSLLQLYGSYYPIQEGVDVADAWSYLKARGILVTNNTSYDYVDINTFLDIAMRIKDEDSRISYKDIQLTISLDQTIVDNGYFPVFGNKLKVVDSYNSKVAYSYDVSNYDLLVETHLGDGEYFAVNLRDGREQGEVKEISVVPIDNTNSSSPNYNKKYVYLSIPYEFVDSEGIVVKKRAVEEGGEDVTLAVIPNEFMTGGIIKLEGSTAVGVTSFDSCDEADKDLYLTFVDNARSNKSAEFTYASFDASLGERIAFFFEYIFTPKRAYAAPEHEETQGNSSLNSGSSIESWEVTLSRSDYKVGALYALYPILMYKEQGSPKVKDLDEFMQLYVPTVGGYGNANSITQRYRVAYGSVTWMGLETKTTQPTQICHIHSWMSNTNNYPNATKAIIDLAGGFIYSGNQYGYNYNTDYNWKQEKKDETLAFMNAVLNYMLKGEGLSYELINYQMGHVKVATSNKWLYNQIRGEDSTAAEDDNSQKLNASTSDIANALQQMQSKGFEGVFTPIPDARQLYADTIMSKRNDIFVAYSALSDAGLVLTSSTPVPVDGIFTFYLTDVGQVIIDDINNEVSINAVFINLGSTEPVYEANGELYINYRCLTGVLPEHQMTDTRTEKPETTGGSGGTATYQLVRGLSKSDDVKMTDHTYVGIEQYSTGDLGNLSGVTAKMFDTYEGKSLPYSFALLNGTYPLANWIIVETDGQAYIYVFYQRGMFDTGWNTDAMATSCWLDEDCIQNLMIQPGMEKPPEHIDKYNWDIDTKIGDVWDTEKGTLSRLTVEGNMAFDNLKKTYGFTDDESLNKYGLLKSTVCSLLSLAQETGVLIENENYVVRRFDVERLSSVEKMNTVEEGKVYDIPNLGYVYTIPTAYDHLKYVGGEHVLPLVKETVGTTAYILDYNMNIYGDVTVAGDATTDANVCLPYGAIVVEKQYSEHDKVTSVKWILKDLMDKFSSKFYVEDEAKLSYYKPSLEGAGSLTAAPVGLYKYISSPQDRVTVNTLNKYTTTASSFYLGARRLSFKDSDSSVKTFSFTRVDPSVSSTILSVAGDTEKALVVTRDYYGRHHFVLSPNTNVSGSIVINVVDANQYAIDYSENPIYAGIKQWISDLDSISTVLLYIMFYIMPMIMLLWILILLALALISNKLVQGVGRMVGMDIVSIFTLGRRTTQEWHSWRVVVPLLVAFVAMGLFYGPNLLRIIEIVTDFAYNLSGLK